MRVHFYRGFHLARSAWISKVEKAEPRDQTAHPCTPLTQAPPSRPALLVPCEEMDSQSVTPAPLNDTKPTTDRLSGTCSCSRKEPLVCG